MMFIHELMERKNMTRAELSRISTVPESTLRDILNGTSRIEHCEAFTLMLIAEALDTTVEEIIERTLAEDDFDNAPIELPPQPAASFYDSMNRIREDCTDYDDGYDLCRFVREHHWIERFISVGAYSTALLLVGLSDYVCRRKKLKPFPEYEKYRHMRLKNPVYPLSLYDPNMTAREFEREISRVQALAIPELAQLNIFLTEKDIIKKE